MPEILELALRYMWHLEDCPYGNLGPDGDFCDCGLGAARKKVREAILKLEKKDA